MEQKKNTGIFSAGILLVGIVIGWGIWGSQGKTPVNTIMHEDMDHGAMTGQTPMTMRTMMESMSANLEGKTGDAFDEAFLEEMIPHHLGAVKMAQLALTSSKRPEIIKLANEILAAQEKEIQQMRAWQKAWFGVQPL